MRALLDVCALLALLDANHVHHVKVSAWFAQNAPLGGWASCPPTQNGKARILGNPGYPNRQPPRATLHKLAAMYAQPAHQFWPASVSLTDASVFDQSVVLSSEQLTHVYLLGLAVHHGGGLVTTDAGILGAAVKGLEKAHLVGL